MSNLYSGVKIEDAVSIDDLALVGYPPYKNEPGLETYVGKGTRIEPFAIVYAGAKIGSNCFVASGAVIREGCILGDNVSVGTNSVILPHATLEDNVRVHSLVEVAEHTLIQEGAWIGPGVKMANTMYPKPFVAHKTKEQADKDGGPVIGRYARVGVNATITAFVKIGDYSIIGAGTVVLKSVPERSVVVGNPGRIVKRSEDIVAVYDKTVRPYDITEDEKDSAV